MHADTKTSRSGSGCHHRKPLIPPPKASIPNPSPPPAVEAVHAGRVHVTVSAPECHAHGAPVRSRQKMPLEHAPIVDPPEPPARLVGAKSSWITQPFGNPSDQIAPSEPPFIQEA